MIVMSFRMPAITLTPGNNEGDIVNAIEGYQIAGFSGFNNPIDLTEDTKKGNIYVSEYGEGGRIVLLKPAITTRHNVRTVMPVRLSQVNPQCDDTLEVSRPHLSLVLANSGFKKIKVYPNPIKVDISGKSLEAGIYFLKIRTDTKTELIKLIIQ